MIHLMMAIGARTREALRVGLGAAALGAAAAVGAALLQEHALDMAAAYVALNAAFMPTFQRLSAADQQAPMAP